MDGLRRLLRLRYPILLVIAAASGIFDASSGLSPVDLGTFLEGAERLLSSRWADTFADSSIQVGPIFLLFIRVARWLAHACGSEIEIVLGGVVHILVVAAVMATTDRVASDRATAPVLSGIAGAIAITAGLAWTSYISGHPEETAIALLWVWTALCAQKGKPLKAGLALAAATGLKLSGVLGLPLLLFVPDTIPRVRALMTFVGVTAIAYGPFFLFGEVNTFSFAWNIESPLADALFEGEQFPWWGRVGQGVATMSAGFAAVWAFRGSSIGVWAVPLVMVAVRIVLDPLPHYYFWLGFEAVSLAAAVNLLPRLTWPPRVILLGFLYALMVGRYAFGTGGFYLRIVFGILIVVAGWKLAEIRSSTSHSPASA